MHDPEVRGQSLRTERRVIEANRIFKGMSRQLKYGVVEINREVYEAGSFPFEQSGIHYSGVPGGRVGDRLGSQATAFLGGPRALKAPTYTRQSWGEGTGVNNVETVEVIEVGAL